MNKDVCMFCGGNLTMLKEYYVCEKCKTVSFRGGIADGEIKSKILDYIDSIDKVRKGKYDFLHSIDQKSLSPNPLSSEEESVRALLESYRLISEELKTYIDGHMALYAQPMREALYKLLLMSEDIAEILYTNFKK